MSNRVVMGIDASLTGTGLVAVPFDWGLDWSRVARAKLGLGLSKGASEVERVRRLDFICSRMAEFAEKHDVTDVFMEQYALSARTERTRAFALGELGGNIKRDVVIGLGLPLTVVAPATARALLGKFSARGKKGAPKPPPVKDQVQAVLRSTGLPVGWDGDETDAWVVANWGLSGIEGADALILREAA
jgi:hypothetical protein